ncbi:MAG: amidohydrolase family protein [Firmicutes bacterium]|nr:amidohydrolase family protein [Bacillota bacterium]
MAFGFFKKREYADIVFKNGRIYTLDPNQPEAEAVACKGGDILAVGDADDMDALIGSDTEVVDLEGKTMLPGFIKMRTALAQEAFATGCRLFPEWTEPGLEGLKTAVKSVVATSQGEEAIFVYGGFRHLLHGLELQEIREELDQVCPDRPLLILVMDCTACLMNTAALDLIHAAAEEDGIHNISLDYIVSVIAPPDYEQYQSYVQKQNRSLTNQGFTTVNDCGSFDYPQAVYRSSLQEFLMEDQLNQRYLSSYVMMEPEDVSNVLRKLRQRQTECIELDGMIRCDGLHICVMPEIFHEDYLEKLCVDAADIGCDLMLTAHGQEAMESAAKTIDAVRSSGYKKNAAVLSYEDVLSDKEIYEFVPEEDVVLWKDLDPSTASTVEQLIDRLTIDAASALAMEDRIGSILKGMAADFTILTKDPYKGSIDAFHNRKVAFTVVNGKIVHC